MLTKGLKIPLPFGGGIFISLSGYDGLTRKVGIYIKLNVDSNVIYPFLKASVWQNTRPVRTMEDGSVEVYCAIIAALCIEPGPKSYGITLQFKSPERPVSDTIINKTTALPFL